MAHQERYLNVKMEYTILKDMDNYFKDDTYIQIEGYKCDLIRNKDQVNKTWLYYIGKDHKKKESGEVLNEVMSVNVVRNADNVPVYHCTHVKAKDNEIKTVEEYTVNLKYDIDWAQPPASFDKSNQILSAIKSPDLRQKVVYLRNYYRNSVKFKLQQIYKTKDGNLIAIKCVPHDSFVKKLEDKILHITIMCNEPFKPQDSNDLVGNKLKNTYVKDIKAHNIIVKTNLEIKHGPRLQYAIYDNIHLKRILKEKFNIQTNKLEFHITLVYGEDKIRKLYDETSIEDLL